MSISRRRFMIVVAAATSTCTRLARCALGATPASGPAESTAPVDAGVVDAGPIPQYTEDKIFETYREQGFFLIHRHNELFALSSICTHRGCKVHTQDDGSYLCKCHGSRFDPDGRVTKGPASRDLPRLALALDADQHVLVDPHRTPPPT